jgi:hypothetical protein
MVLKQGLSDVQCQHGLVERSDKPKGGLAQAGLVDRREADAKKLSDVEKAVAQEIGIFVVSAVSE